MTINVTDAKANYVASAQLAGVKYKKKVSVNTTCIPNGSSPQAEQNWAAAVAAAAAEQRRAKELAKVTQSYWVQQASTIGAASLPMGMTGHADKWQTGFSPFAPILDNLVNTLPPRGVGASANLGRVAHIALGLEAAKKAM